MPFNAPVKGKSEPVPAGTHIGILYQFLHLGTIDGKFGPKDTIRLTFELPEETKVFKEGEEAKPLVISREFGNTMSGKGNLRPFVESMIGVSLDDEEAGGFDLMGLLGMSCLLNVVHDAKDGNTYSNIASVSPLLKSMKKPEQFNSSVFFDINHFDQEVFNTLPEFLRKKIEGTLEFSTMKNRVAEQGGEDTLNF